LCYFALRLANSSPIHLIKSLPRRKQGEKNPVKRNKLDTSILVMMMILLSFSRLSSTTTTASTRAILLKPAFSSSTSSSLLTSRWTTSKKKSQLMPQYQKQWKQLRSNYSVLTRHTVITPTTTTATTTITSVVDAIHLLGGGSKRSMSDSNDKKEEAQAQQQPSTGIEASITFAKSDEEGDDNNEDNSKSDSDSDIDPSLYTQPIIIEMPPMDDVGGDASHCSIEEWYKKEGDIVRTNDVLCDISTPDFIFRMQIDDDEIGILKSIHVQPNIKVPDHTPICTIYHKKKPSKFVENIKGKIEIQKEKIEIVKEKIKSKMEEKITSY